MVTAGGFALAALSPMSVGKQVFLLVIGPITTVMHGIDKISADIQKDPETKTVIEDLKKRIKE